MSDFLMPSLGADMEKGVIVEWLIGPGDRVERGDVVVLVETEKGIIEVEVWQDATVESIVVPVGEEVPVGAVIATLAEAERTPPRAAAPAAATTRKSASPSDMRRAIGRAMSRSKREIPHYYLGTTVDMTAGLDWLQRHNAATSITARIIPAALLLKATALAAAAMPEFNGHYDHDQFSPSPTVDLGVAISTRNGGLMAPAIRDCHDQALDDLMAQLSDLVSRARRGRLRESEVAAPTITVTNLGERGVEVGYGVIIPPQVALVCFGKIVDRPAVVDGSVSIRSLMTATLSADHRVSDGHRGAAFLDQIDQYLQKPEEL